LAEIAGTIGLDQEQLVACMEDCRDEQPGPGDGFGPQNMALVRHIAMNLVRNPKDRHSLKVRRKLANLNPDYLETLIRQNAVNLKRFPCFIPTSYRNYPDA
jgi:hypothetical protein